MIRRVARSLVLALGCVLALGASAATSILPDTSMGRRAQGYLDAFNTGREDVMRAFLAANVAPASLKERPLEERIGAFRQMKDEFGTLTPTRLVEARDDEVRVKARARTGGDVDLTFRFEPEAPHLMTSLSLRVTSGPGGEEEPPAAPSRAMSEEEAIGAWRAHLDSLARADRFSGAALVAKGDQTLFSGAYGMADRARRVPNEVDTRFNLGSINKIFTKVAIAQLVEQGKLRVDDTVDRYLPDYPKAVASKVTIRQLLDHRGGIGDIFGDAYDRADHSKLRRNADFIPLFRDRPLAFEPGTRQEYSNGGYVLLGAIIEKVSGEDYYDYVRRHIYEPLGMTATAHYPSDGKTANLAQGYTREPEARGPRDAAGLAENRDTRPWRGSAAGGGYSTVDDLLRFVQALRQGRLVKRETLREGFGELAADADGNLGLGIGGGAPGINAAIETQGPWTIIVLANLDPPAAMDAAGTLRGWLPAGGGRVVRRMIGGPGASAPGTQDEAAPAPRRARMGAKKSVIPATPVVVEMTSADHMPAVSVMLDGQGPFRFAIDTGAHGAARLDSAVAARLGLPVIGQARAGDPSGRNTRVMDLVEIGSLEIGGARFEGVTAAVRDYNERRLGESIDGILGFGLFEEVLFTLDYPAHRVRIERGELPAANGKDVIPFRLDRGIPSIDLQVGSLTVDADVDAGQMGGFMLPARLIDELPLAGDAKVVGKARTVSNEFEIREARLNGIVRLGGYEFQDATLGFQPLFPMGNVGARVLREFAVTFDQRNLRMRLARKG